MIKESHKTLCKAYADKAKSLITKANISEGRSDKTLLHVASSHNTGNLSP